MASSASSKPRLPTFSGQRSKFSEWTEQLTAYAYGKGHSYHLLIAVWPDDYDQDETEDDDDLATFNLIVECLRDSALTAYTAWVVSIPWNQRTTEALWAWLTERYKGRPDVLNDRLISELTTLSPCTNKNHVSFVRSIRNKYYQLVTQGGELSEAQVTRTTLTRLPDHVSNVLTSGNNEPRTLDALLTVLERMHSANQAFSQPNRQPPKPNNRAALLATNGKGKGRNNGTRFKGKGKGKSGGKDTSQYICRRCGRKGHSSTRCAATGQCPKCDLFGHTPGDPLCGSSTSGAPSTKRTVGFMTVTRLMALASNPHPELDMRQLIIADTGCNNNIVNDPSLFDDLEDVDPELYAVHGANADLELKVTGKGTARITTICQTDQGQDDISLTASNTLYCSGVSANLLSVSQMVAAGYTFHSDPDQAYIICADAETIIPLVSIAGLFIIPTPNVLDAFDACNLDKAVAFATRSMTHEDLHRLLGHISRKAATKTIANSTGIEIVDEQGKKALPCETCDLVKLKRTPVKKATSDPATHFHQRVHVDLLGPTNVKSIDGGKYALSVTDAYSKMSSIYILPDKNADTVRDAMKDYIMSHPVPIQHCRHDPGSEFVSNSFAQLLREHSIISESTLPKTPEQNGQAERTQQTLFTRAKALLKDSGLPKPVADRLWSYALRQAVFLYNRTWHSSINTAPITLFSGGNVSPDLSALHPFGCVTFTLEETDTVGKLRDKSWPGIYLGQGLVSDSSIVYSPENGRVIHSRNVSFHDSKRWLDNNPDCTFADLPTSLVPDIPDISPSALLTPKATDGDDANTEDADKAPDVDQATTNTTTSDANPTAADASVANPDILDDAAYNEVYTRSGRRVKPVDRPNYSVLGSIQAIANLVKAQDMRHQIDVYIQTLDHAKRIQLASEMLAPIEPSTLAEALSGPQASQWWDAVLEEVEGLMSRDPQPCQTYSACLRNAGSH
eukprot:TRINITY_DN51_c0_g1_i5.p1 TRINITY_DN51_c0_g1~~TRINITY_DN51_c0_g1_i5.p1  ORF type:complete len:961 (+),score=129.87 TRINITY_DN51_c0_g1_i5:3226-6108(+)